MPPPAPVTSASGRPATVCAVIVFSLFLSGLALHLDDLGGD
jgi:hypothetical protein